MENKERQFERLTVNERFQHFFLLFSFILLVITGAPLFLHEFRLFHIVINSDDLFRLRGGLHRFAAIVLIALVIYHVLYLLFSRRGHREFILMLPGKKDFIDFFLTVKYNMGLTDTPPRYGRYNFIHKFEYWAVMWGSAVMIITGMVLWFQTAAMMFMPKWVMDIAKVIHGYEAVLAFLAIIIWHFYNVHLNPDVFPMSWTWITGTIGEKEMKKNHPLEYEEIIAGEKEPPAKEKEYGV